MVVDRQSLNGLNSSFHLLYCFQIASLVELHPVNKYVASDKAPGTFASCWQAWQVKESGQPANPWPALPFMGPERVAPDGTSSFNALSRRLLSLRVLQ
jgi:hypothetical protein